MQALDSYLLMDRGEMWPALAYMVGSVVLSIAGLFAGLQMIRAVS
jgi:CrcB protein